MTTFESILSQAPVAVIPRLNYLDDVAAVILDRISTVERDLPTYTGDKHAGIEEDVEIAKEVHHNIMKEMISIRDTVDNKKLEEYASNILAVLPASEVGTCTESMVVLDSEPFDVDAKSVARQGKLLSAMQHMQVEIGQAPGSGSGLPSSLKSLLDSSL